MSDTAPPEPPAAGAARTTDETKAIIRSIVATGIGLATLLLMLAGLMFQQVANLNTRIDDLGASLNARIDDLNDRIDEINAGLSARIDDLNDRIDEVSANLNARIDEVSASLDARIDDLAENVREVRALLIDTIKRIVPAG